MRSVGGVAGEGVKVPLGFSETRLVLAESAREWEFGKRLRNLCENKETSLLA